MHAKDIHSHKVRHTRSNAVSVRTDIIQKYVYVSIEPWECICNSPNPFFHQYFLSLYDLKAELGDLKSLHILEDGDIKHFV